MIPPSPLDDPATAGFAWARYRRLMKLMTAITLGVVGIALYALHRSQDEVSIHFYIATGLGIFAAMMLMAALMGLVFLSNGTGHDHAISDRLEEERNR